MDDSHFNNEIEERVVIKKKDSLGSRKDKLELRVENSESYIKKTYFNLDTGNIQRLSNQKRSPLFLVSRKLLAVHLSFPFFYGSPGFAAQLKNTTLRIIKELDKRRF